MNILNRFVSKEDQMMLNMEREATSRERKKGGTRYTQDSSNVQKSSIKNGADVRGSNVKRYKKGFGPGGDEEDFKPKEIKSPNYSDLTGGRTTMNSRSTYWSMDLKKELRTRRSNVNYGQFEVIDLDSTDKPPTPPKRQRLPGEHGEFALANSVCLFTRAAKRQSPSTGTTISD